MTVHYLRAKLKTLLQNVEMQQKIARKRGDSTIPTPRTSLLDNLSAAQLRKISKNTSVFFCDFPDLIKFFEPLPPPEHHPIPEYDPKQSWPCQRAARGLSSQT